MTDTQRNVVITGAAGGMGRAACERLARNGWNVLAVDVNEKKLKWADGQDSIVPFTADITSEQDNLSMIQLAEERFGGLDAAILNAAVSVSGNIEAIPWEDFERAISINLIGTALGIRATLPALRRRGGGAIVVTASTHGLAGDTDNCAYIASKHGVVGLVRAVARDVGWEGIRINAICPGLTRATGMTEMIERDMAEGYKHLARSVPLQRWSEPDEQAAVMEFLISPAASYVNGVAMPVDGGTITGSGLLPPAAGEGNV